MPRWTDLPIDADIQEMLSYLLALDEPGYASIRSMLDDGDLDLDLDSLAAGVESAAPGASSKSLVSFLAAMAAAAYQEEGRTEGDIAQAIAARFAAETENPDSEATLGERLEQLASALSVQLLAKAITLLNEPDGACDIFRIVTDLRPVFVGDEPKGAVIAHTLRFATGSADEVVVYLSDEGLEDLEKEIGRARLKSQSLRPRVGDAGLVLIDVRYGSGE